MLNIFYTDYTDLERKAMGLHNVVDKEWKNLTHEQKNHALFLKEKDMLDVLLEHGAITQAQHDKSLHDLMEKMGEAAELQ